MFWRASGTPKVSPQRIERRLAPRRNCAIAAEIVFDGGRKVMPCTIRNVSNDGAKLELRSLVGVPGNILLRGAGFEAQHCRVVWRTLREMGVEFQRT